MKILLGNVTTLLCILYIALFFQNMAMADHPIAAFGLESSGPINTISAQSLQQGDWSIGLRLDMIEFDAFSDAELEQFAVNGIEDVHSIDRLISASLALSYGITDKLMLSMRLPYIDRTNIREGEIEDGEAEAHLHGDASGNGDLVAFGHYLLFSRNSFSSALHFGVKAPTGQTDERDDDELLEVEFQPGSGSWDVLFGGAVGFTSGRTGLHANILYNLTSEGDQDTELGDAFFFNAAATLRLFGGGTHPHDIVPDVHNHSLFSLDGMVELNGEARAKNQIDGINEDNTGGIALYLAPGLRLSHTSGFSSFVSFGFPLTTDLNGEQADPDYRLVAGASILF